MKQGKIDLVRYKQVPEYNDGVVPIPIKTKMGKM